ncbi:regulator of G-protein signaling loco-like isoform X2 [Atheta coriaria]|uniref:regulator of G-protein signaling loco-like isoform X2 n=1 Tax=Dalotia coriaria TaxID=877792 RepID=UPI0031F3D8AC
MLVCVVSEMCANTIVTLVEGAELGQGLVVALRPPFRRLNNSFRRIGSQRLARNNRPKSVAALDGDSKCEDNCIVKACGDGPAAWATSFEELLKCPAGLHTFAEFLKKEFSAENIYFWTACERFRKITSTPERVAEAQRIFHQHLRLGAGEAVNIDSKARQCAEQNLHNVNATIFAAAQKQIFNLMKFDSYTRFLKSDLYKQCLAGKGEDYKLDPNLNLQITSAKPKRSLSNAEDRRRKSLLPWHRKNRSKSKECGDEPKPLQHDVNENFSSSKSSLTSLDIGISSNSDISKVNDERIANGRHPLCRIKLTNGASTMTQLKQDETIEDLVTRLLEKRGIVYSAFAVYTNKETKALNISESALKLAGCEVDIEQRVCFKLNLPNKKVIAVKSKSTKLLVEVLRPILEKYSYILEQVTVSFNNEPANIHLQVTSFDNERIIVQLKEAPKIETPSTLEEITNRVYEDILQEKSEVKKAHTESVKSEDWGSEHSSNMVGRFMKRDSERNRKKKLSGRSKLNSASTHSSIEDIVADENPFAKKPLIAKLKVGVMLQNTSESEDLYEGLNRAQRGRLDDQRGTKINYTMPDFLKNERLVGARHATQIIPAKPERTNNVSVTAKNLKLELHSDYENQNNVNGALSLSSPFKCIPVPDHTPSERVPSACNVVRVEPPPLPPKPKIVPIKPSN